MSIDFVVFFALRRHLTDLNMKIQQDAGKEYGTALNGLMMIETIKANGNESDFFVKWADFKTSYTGIVLNVEPNETFKKEGSRYNIFKAVAEKLAHDKWTLLFILLLSLCMIIPGLATPIFSQIFLDEILTRKHTDWMFNFCLAMMVSFIVCGVMN